MSGPGSWGLRLPAPKGFYTFPMLDADHLTACSRPTPHLHAGSNLCLSLALTWKLFSGRFHCGKVGQLRPHGDGGGCVCGKSGEEVGPPSGLKGQQKGHHQGRRQQPEPQPSLPAAGRTWRASNLGSRGPGWPWGDPGPGPAPSSPFCQDAPHPARVLGGPPWFQCLQLAEPGKFKTSCSLRFSFHPRKLAWWPCSSISL